MIPLLECLLCKYEDNLGSIPRTHTIMLGMVSCATISMLGRQKQVDLWGSWTSQPSLLDEFRLGRNSVLKKTKIK